MYDKSVKDTCTRNAKEEVQRPMRDNRGRFVKGHKPLKRPKYDRIRENPKLICDTCHKAKECPEFEPNSACAYISAFNKNASRNLECVLNALHTTIEYNAENMQYHMVLDRLSGKHSSKVSRLINQNSKLMTLLIDTYTQIDQSKSRYTPTIQKMLSDFFMRDCD